MPRAVAVIPARWDSSRFPGKVIATLGGQPLVLHCCSIARQAAQVHKVIVAVDDARVRDVVQQAGYETVDTRPDHPSGTDRVCEVVEGLEAEIVIGLQADEPFLSPRDLDALVAAVSDPARSSSLATLSVPATSIEQWHDPNAVKVVTDRDARALFFSRSPLPYRRPESGPFPVPPSGPLPAACRIHVGVYAWRRERLFEFTAMPPSPLELSEGLEQLRALEAGWSIAVLPAKGQPFGIDTPEDLQRAERWLSSHPAHEANRIDRP